MSKMKLQQILDYEGITKITIENDMAPLALEASPHARVEISGELDLVQPFEEFTWEDCVTVTFNDGNLKIALEEVESIEPRFLGNNRSAIKILVPAGPAVSLILENLPLSISGLTNALEVASENAPIRIQDCHNSKKLSNENGPISLKNCEGSLIIELENGPLSAENISGDRLKIDSENGPLKIREACFQEVNITNR
ncbi:MAG: hypothetical protein RBS43_09170, partial [Candidatus Cloacimonas sp.]|nr:hypothetical protein [Candidatus Cloacimonas sp.]